MVKKRSIPRLILSLLLALSIVRCTAPLVMRIFQEICADEIIASIKVLEKNLQTGGSEVWITTLDENVDLPDAVQNSDFKGELQYREAADYGYGYNFLVSYGNNIGSVLRIKSKSGYFADEVGFLVYKNPQGALIELSYKNTIQQVDLYSELPEVVPINLEKGRSMLLPRLIELAVLAGLSVLLYLLFPRLWERKENAKTESSRSPSSENPEDGTELLGVPSRIPSVDLARTVAAFLVILVHTFLASGYYNAQLIGKKMLLLTFLRWVALDCVPLFMLITGYLCAFRRDISKTYQSLIQPISLFVLVTLTKIVLIDGLWLGGDITLDGILSNVVRMDLAWYLRMYIGLVLLMPFLNRMWHGIRRSEKQILLAVLLMLTAGRSVFGQFFPSYWIAIYPLTYYFLGAYLREFPLTTSKEKLALLFVAVILTETIFTFNNGTAVFDWNMFGGYECDYPAFLVVVSTVLLFSFLRQVRIKNAVCKRILALCGRHTLGIYLVSVAITDNFVHPPLQKIFTTPQDYMWVQLPAALVSFLFALVLSVLFTSFIKNLQKMLQRRK